MTEVGSFMKVSKQQFAKDLLAYVKDNKIDNYTNCTDLWGTEYLEETFNAIGIPRRATKGSAGYDFVSPVTFALDPHKTIKIPLGIRANIKDGWFLGMFPRSSFGFNFKVMLDNTIGVIDSDYFHAENGGHIMLQITNHGEHTLYVNAGDRIVQGVFIPFGVVIGDNTDSSRTGGFGSTGGINKELLP